jgi:hypothetical protein
MESLAKTLDGESGERVEDPQRLGGWHTRGTCGWRCDSGLNTSRSRR